MRLDLMKQLNGMRCRVDLNRLVDYTNFFLRDSQVFAFLKIARSLPVVPTMAEAPD